MHGALRPEMLPAADILIIAGDICNNYYPHRGYISWEQEQDAVIQKLYIKELDSWLGELKRYSKILVIGGNHDFCFFLDWTARNLFKHATYLQDEAIVVDGVKFYGSPWCPNFNNWAFMFPYEDTDLERAKWTWAMIPDDTDVLITHSPPRGILDLTRAAGHKGCIALAERIKQLKLKLHIFGHVHESYGREKIGDTLHANVALNTRDLKPINPVQVFEI